MAHSDAYEKGWAIMPDDTEVTPAVRTILEAEREGLKEALENAESDDARNNYRGALDKIDSLLTQS